MNYLAHLFLSGKNSEVILGNLLEDFVVGNINHKRNEHFSAGIKLGIVEHRLIDTFTDTDMGVKECKKLFYDKFGKYSPIIIDVLFDHFLILNWNKFTDEDFGHFRKRIYTALLEHQEIQPEKMKTIVASMIQHDWLKNYIEIWGLERSFVGLNHKINKAEIDLTQSIPIFQANYDLINREFIRFFTDLKIMCDNFLKENNL